MSNLLTGLGGSAGFGENSVSRNDDGYSSAVDMTGIFESGINFFGQSWDSIYVNTNGNITFSRGLSTFTPQSIGQGFDSPIIAPFWADVDTRSGETIPSVGGTSQGSNLVWYDLDTNTNSITITWDDVGYYYRNDDLTNAFQLQIVKTSDSGDFDMVFRYENIDWLTGDASGGVGGFGGEIARAGFASGDGNIYYEFPQSGSNAMLDLDAITIGGSTEPGLWRYSVQNGDVGGIGQENSDDTLTGSASDDIMDGGSGNDTLYGEAGNDSLSGGLGDDIIYAGAGDDQIFDGAGADYYDGGDGFDILYFFNNSINDFIIEYLEGVFNPQSATHGNQTQSSSSSGYFSMTNIVTGEEDIVVNMEQAQFNDGTYEFEVPSPAPAPTLNYLTSDTKHIILPAGEAQELKTLPQMSYSGITIELVDAQSQALIGATAIASAAHVILPENVSPSYAFNSQTGVIEVMSDAGHIMTTLPIDSEGRTLSTVQLGSSGDILKLQVNSNDLSVDFDGEVYEINTGEEPTENNGAASLIYLSSQTKNIILPAGEAQELKTLPQMDYSGITIELMDTQAQLLISSSAIAAASEIILPENATLNYVFNTQTGLVEISNEAGQLMVTLPIDGDGRTQSTLQLDGTGTAVKLQVNGSDLSVSEVAPDAPLTPPEETPQESPLAPTNPDGIVFDVPHSAVELNGLQVDWVNDTGTDPFSSVGYIKATYDSMPNNFFSGSGVLISPQHVLTNSHVVMEGGNLANGVSFFAGLNGENTATYTSAEAIHLYAQSDTELTMDNIWPDNDIAIITLSESIGDDLGYYSLFSTTEDQLTSQDVFWAGYPQADIMQDNPETPWEDIYQWRAFGEVFDYSDDGWFDGSGQSANGGDGQLWFTETMAGTSGASGSPVFYQNGDELAVVGVYSGSSGDVPVAANIDTDSYQWISNILAADGYAIA